MKRLYLSLLCVSLIIAASVAHAGGPLVTCNGRTVVYGSGSLPLQYSVDLGPLGSLTNEQASTLVDEAFDVWAGVATASLTLQNAGALAENVNADNFSVYDDFNDGINPMIFDEDGSIIDSLYGSGASDSIIGFAGSDYDETSCTFTEGMALLNGKFTDYFTYEQFKATFVHEFGHFFGLDHSQINLDYAGDGDVANDIYIPTMFPTSTDDDTSLGDLNPDDEAALTLLYPADAGVVDAAYGTISGTVTWRDGSAVLGANVVAVQVGDEDYSRFSSVSDYYMQNTGDYAVTVTPGTYRIFIEAVYSSFTGGSSVGPYALTPWSESFSNPVETAYYETEVTVAAGQTVTGIDFIAQPAFQGLCPAAYVLTGDRQALAGLRQLRDMVLSRTAAGRALVGLYYRNAENIASVLRASPVLRNACRLVMKALAGAVQM